MNHLFRLMIFCCAITGLFSCVQTNKLYLFNDQVPSEQALDSLKPSAIQVIHPNDRLNITVSSTDPSLTAYLNPFNLQQSQSNANQQSNSGYLVNASGEIEFPLLGKVSVIGMTTNQVAATIKEKLSFYYKDLFVNVNLNGRVFFMNGRQGSAIPMLNERMTIFEALTQSGAQDPFDVRNKVWLVREDSGKRYFTRLNLNSKKIFESPYYYLHNNDLVYLQPGKYSSILNPSSPVRGIITLAGSLAAILIAIKNL